MKWKRDILRADGDLYLTRYTLLWLPFLRIRLHHIFLSDYDCLHDHPWDFISVILKGGYWEIYQPDQSTGDPYLEALRFSFPEPLKYKKWYGPGSILFRRAEDKHRLEIPPGKTAWTLVFMFKRRREWGFWNKGKFIHWKDYDSKQKCE